MCVNIANVLHANGHEVILCATRAGGPLEKFVTPGIRCEILHKKHSADFLAFMRLVRIIRENDIQLIHAHSSSVFWAVAAKLFIKNIKVIWHDHLGLRICERNTNFFYKLISRWIDGIIAVNKDLAEWSRMNMRVSPEKIVLINNFALLRETSKSTDLEFLTVVCLANLRPQKDHETLIRAIGILKKEQLPKKLKIILAGAYQKDKYFSRLRDLMNELAVNDIIELAGSVEDTATLLAAADCGVLSSVSEGLPLSLLEYGMAGLPVVVTNVGQCAEVVGNGRFGRIVPPGKPTATAKELLWIIQNKLQAKQMGDSFKDHIIKNYSSSIFLAKYKLLSDSILS